MWKNSELGEWREVRAWLGMHSLLQEPESLGKGRSVCLFCILGGKRQITGVNSREQPAPAEGKLKISRVVLLYARLIIQASDY